MILRLGLLGLVLIVVVGCSKQSSVPPSSAWTTFNSTDAPFSVLLPSKPKRQEQSANGVKVVMHVCDHNDFAVLAGSNEMPVNIDLKNKDQVKIVLDEAVKGGLRAQKAKLKEQRDLVLQGKYPCREATATLKAPNGSEGTIRLRIALLPDKLIQVLAVGDSKSMQAPQIKKCLDSLKIKK